MDQAAHQHHRKPLTITKADEAILLLVQRYYFLTAAQLSRRLYESGYPHPRYAQRRLKRLSDAGYLLRLRDIPTPMFGSAPHVFVLGKQGRSFLDRRGYELLPYYRPSEERERTNQNLEHSVEVVDVLILADLLSKHDPSITVPLMINERAFKHLRLRVSLPRPDASDGRRPLSLPVMPDSLFKIQFGQDPPSSVVLELDRGSESQSRWRRKVAALLAWVLSTYPEQFEAENVTFIVVTPEDTKRRDTLRRWSLSEIKQRYPNPHEQEQLADLFLFTAGAPSTLTPEQFFFEPIWYGLRSDTPVPLFSEESQLEEVPRAYL